MLSPPPFEFNRPPPMAARSSASACIWAFRSRWENKIVSSTNGSFSPVMKKVGGNCFKSAGGVKTGDRKMGLKETDQYG